MSSAIFVSVAIAAAAFFQLSGRILDQASSSFFACSWNEQLAMLALVFSVIFAAVSISHVGVSAASSSASSSKGFGSYARNFAVHHTVCREHRYPIEELAKCTDDKARFLALYPMLREDIVAHMRDNNEMPDEALEWIQEMMDYNVPGGKLNRGITVLSVYRALLGGREMTPLETAKAAVLGWAIEFLQAFFLVSDDLMDGSQTRRGQPCWYKKPKIGFIAVNDSFLLESFVFAILREHFQGEPFYTDLLELLLDVTQKTECGQLLDLTSQPNDHNKQQNKQVDLTRFTEQRYKLIVKYKTAFYSFYLPIALGMMLAGITDRKDYDTARRILVIMGEYFQVQDDVLDCYGDPAVIGKVGTDIQDSKCSWLVVQALKLCNEQQRKLLQDNYGASDEKQVQKVKELYTELKLKELFEAYEEESYRQIQAELDQITMPRDVFEILLNKIYKRSM